MKAEEFRNWLAYHIAAFPGIAEWGSRQDNWAAVKAAWERVLADVQLEDAKVATDAMNRGELKEPKGYGSHAREIRFFAKKREVDRRQDRKRHKPKMIDGKPIYDCWWCEDSGVLYVFHPDSMRQQEDGTLKRDYIPHVNKALPVRCDCDAGQDSGSPVPMLNRNTMVPMVGSIDAMFNALEKFIADWKVKRTENAPNYSPALAEWSK